MLRKQISAPNSLPPFYRVPLSCRGHCKQMSLIFRARLREIIHSTIILFLIGDATVSRDVLPRHARVVNCNP